jgi:probable DNA metabolism protein
MSLAIHYDSTFNGFLSAVFEIYRQHLDVSGFVAERSYEVENETPSDLFALPFHVETSEESANRLRRAIANAASKDVLGLLETCFRSETAGIEMSILAYLRKLFAGLDPNYGKNPSSLEMIPLITIARSVRHEMDNMFGMVRFNKAPDGMYVAEIEPKYDILDMLIGHFRSRYPNGTWAIIDVKRCFGVYYENYRTHFVTVPDPNYVSAHAPPDEFTRMWKSYYDTMAIKERLNPRLLRRCLPVRYWKHLPERSLSGDFQGRSGASSAWAAHSGSVQPLPSTVAQANALASMRLK